MSRLANEQTEALEQLEAEAPRILARIAAWLRRKGHPVQGTMFVHALEDLVRPQPEPLLDAGWPRENHVSGEVNR